MRHLLIALAFLFSSGAHAQIPVATADTNFYVNPTGNDAGNNCLTQTAPCKTITYSVSQVLKYVFNGFSMTINLAHGTYNEKPSGVRIYGPFMGPALGGQLVIKGDKASPQSVVIDSGEGNGIYVWGCFVIVEGITVGSSVRDGLAVLQGWLRVGKVQYNKARFHLRADYGGVLQLSDNSTVTGGASAHYYAKNGGILEAFGYTTTIKNTPAFTGAFALAQFGRIDTAGMVYNGAATGWRYWVVDNGTIQTNGGGYNYFPGSVPGEVGASPNWGVYGP